MLRAKRKRPPTQGGALAGAADVEAAAHRANKRNQATGLLASQAGQPSNAGSLQHDLRAEQALTLMAPHHDASIGRNTRTGRNAFKAMHVSAKAALWQHGSKTRTTGMTTPLRVLRFHLNSQLSPRALLGDCEDDLIGK